jgi:hypothetical protein
VSTSGRWSTLSSTGGIPTGPRCAQQTRLAFARLGLLERLWAETVRRARQLDPELLNESVAGEWSFIETLRHLAFASLLCSLNEEWEHRLYAERDLSVVEARTP